MRRWDFKDNHLPSKVGALTMLCNMEPRILYPFHSTVCGYSVPFDDVTTEDVMY
jgi:hypothetical protein